MPQCNSPHNDDLKALRDGELSWLRRWAVQRHVQHCALCREELDTMDRITTSLRSQATTEPLSTDLRARILGAVATEPQLTPTTSRPRFSPPTSLLWGAGALVATAIGAFFLIPRGGSSTVAQSESLAKQVLPESTNSDSGAVMNTPAASPAFSADQEQSSAKGAQPTAKTASPAFTQALSEKSENGKRAIALPKSSPARPPKPNLPAPTAADKPASAPTPKFDSSTLADQKASPNVAADIATTPALKATEPQARFAARAVTTAESKDKAPLRLELTVEKEQQETTAREVRQLAAALGGSVEQQEGLSSQNSDENTITLRLPESVRGQVMAQLTALDSGRRKEKSALMMRARSNGLENGGQGLGGFGGGGRGGGGGFGGNLGGLPGSGGAPAAPPAGQNQSQYQNVTGRANALARGQVSSGTANIEQRGAGQRGGSGGPGGQMRNQAANVPAEKTFVLTVLLKTITPTPTPAPNREPQ